MRAPALFGIIVLIHATAIGLFSLMQGCATRRPGEGMGNVPPATERVSTDTPAPVASTLPPATVGSVSRVPSAPMPPKRADLKPLPPIKPPAVVQTPRTVKPPVAQAPRKPLPLPKDGTPYEIKSGDVLSKIAAAHGVSTLELASYNGLSNPGAIRKGQKIMIPPGATKKPPVAASSFTAPAASPSAPAAVTAAGGEYKVQPGDILSRIAARHGVTTAALKKANNLTSDSLRVNQVLKIPGAAPAAPVAPPSGPVLESVTPAAVLTPAVAIPPVATTNTTTAGATDVAITPVAPQPVASDLSKPFEYVVPEGETLDDIARMFIVTPDSIRKLNGLAPADAIKAGQRIKIPPSQY